MKITCQLKRILSDEAFWKCGDSSFKFKEIPESILLEITGVGDDIHWKVTWPNGREDLSPKPFCSWQDAKLDLRNFATQKLSELAVPDGFESTQC